MYPSVIHGAKLVVAIPARNEQQFICGCLHAFAKQSKRADALLLLVNNTTDGTAAIARNFADRFKIALYVREVVLPEHFANAGTVRRLAMNWALDVAGPQGVILTTDADGVVPNDWISRNLAWLQNGHDAVCGMAQIDPADEALIPAHLIEDDEAETNYAGILDEICQWIDPDSWNPWPRHTQCSGASIAVRAAIYKAVGGLPMVNHSEDRGFIAKLIRRDCKVRHDPGVKVRVSGRTIGRAAGGMADTIARRIVKQDKWADSRLEPVEAAIRRAGLRRFARSVWASQLKCDFLAASLSLPAGQVETSLRNPWFGAAWSELETLSACLQYQPVAMATLNSRARVAMPILLELRQGGTSTAWSAKAENEWDHTPA